ncbi:hypothetical protein DRE_03370 [Drechslerella stenobrocha 248]|uniref:Helicase ATP-binding domain-containing protein n=1 Tax=Drechslerella stenobrocha 248 TaxID=1043628 RepID=W7HT24_9PEZI|nr:hypothetical protein DRE_03370 [Drechslerella stenobrocha 248]
MAPKSLGYRALERLPVWYSFLHPLSLDLVGDYAGQELFFIDGDSLVLHATQDTGSIKGSLEVVSAIYAIEKFLNNLRRRGCNFHVIFFEDRRLLSFNHATTRRNRAGHPILIREAFFHHLQQSLTADNPVKVHQFKSLADPAFKRYLSDAKPYFCMAHDAVASARSREQHLLQCGMLWSLMRDGYNVALLDRVEFRDSKVITLVVEGQGSPRLSPGFEQQLAQDIERAVAVVNHRYGTRTQGGSSQLSPSAGAEIGNPREYAAVVALASALNSSDEAQKHVENYGFAFLQHTALLEALTLDERCVDTVEICGEEEAAQVEDFVDLVCRFLSTMLADTQQMFPGNNVNLFDIIDVRLLKYCLADVHFGDTAAINIRNLARAFNLQTESTLEPPESGPLACRITSRATNRPAAVAVLPFQHKAFDAHLAGVQLDIDRTNISTSTPLHRLVQETTHWHSTRLLKEEIKVFNKWQHRSEQIQRSIMQRYAASLTGNATQSLEPELILVDGRKGDNGNGKALASSSGGAHSLAVPESSSTAAESTQNSPPRKNPSASLKRSPMKKADAIREANIQAKAKKVEDKIISVWGRVLDELVALCENARTRGELEDASQTALGRISEFQRVKLKGEQTTYVYLETRLYRLKVLLGLWQDACGFSKKKNERYNLAAQIFDEARHILASPASTKKATEMVKNTWVNMGFGQLPADIAPPGGTDRMSSKAQLLPVKPEMKVDLSAVEFQLTYSGPYMDRSFGSAPDKRVKFHPDAWQRDVLDQIDANKSVFVVAPTSAGKTFISFYAMEKILRGSDTGVLVYVAPTKALVNQIAAEVLARFTKKYPHAGQTVWAIHTRDYKINQPDKCQILVTVPHILQIMLLAPHNAIRWAPRVKRIIFDEIHSIGQAEDGVIWEQLLLLAPCPIIALSATVGNPTEFRDWLVDTQKAAKNDLKMIEHKHRYSDLRKFIYQPSDQEPFRGLSPRRYFEELDDEPEFTAINPISTLMDVKHRALPDDLSLEPRDCLQLYHCMAKHQTDKYRVEHNLQPSKWFQGPIKKSSVVDWEAALKKKLEGWMANVDSPFDLVMADLISSHPTPCRNGAKRKSEVPPGNNKHDDHNDHDDHDNDKEVRMTVLPLLNRLHSKNALPAILFSFDRSMVEMTAATILGQLQKAEAEFKKTDPYYLAELKLYQEYLEEQERNEKRGTKPTKQKVAKKGEKNSQRRNRDDEVNALKNDRNEEASKDTARWANFNPKAPHKNFVFVGKVNHDVEEEIQMLQKAGVPNGFISILRRGIGIHHAGLSRKLREATETLFRMGYLQVVIATGTLALGINMPCKTVGFVGDTVYLTALSYRQCAGRAGRRGFDLFGNVVFHGLSPAKVNRIISSRLPSLHGHFPISTSLVLRLFTLTDGSQDSPYSHRAVNQLLSQARLCLGGDSFKAQVMHHLRFSIEYLRRQQLIDAKGKAINFAGLVGHLYYTQNSAFAFHALLKEGVLHTICSDIESKPQKTCLMLMLVMAHVFGRRKCRDPRRMSNEQLEAIKKSPSDVFLPPLPNIARQALVSHNEETLKTFTGYVVTFANQHCRETPDNVLPFTGKSVGRDTENAEPTTHVHARSAFYRLSGYDDVFASAGELAGSVRNGVFLEPSAVPIIDVENGVYNAYLLDFWKHASVQPLEVANGLRKGDVWFVLNDFSMVLATIVTAIKNFFSEKEIGGLEEGLEELLAMEEGEPVEDDDDGMSEASSGLMEDEGDLDMSKVSHAALQDPDGMLKVYKAFMILKLRFDVKLKAIGATKRPEAKQKMKRPRLRVEPE